MDLKKSHIKEIEHFPNVENISYENNTLQIVYKKGKNNVVELLEYLNQNKIKYNKIFSERPSLNDVFLYLTGKELRD